MYASLPLPFVIGLLWTTPALASPVIFTDRATFEAASQSDVHVPFDSLIPTPFPEYCPPELSGMNECSGIADGVLRIISFGQGFSHVGDGHFSFPSSPTAG